MTINVERIELLVTINDDATDPVLGGVYRTSVTQDLGDVSKLTAVSSTQLANVKAAVLAEFKRRRDALIAQVKNPVPVPVPDAATLEELRAEKRDQLRGLLNDLDALDV